MKCFFPFCRKNYEGEMAKNSEKCNFQFAFSAFECLLSINFSEDYSGWD